MGKPKIAPENARGGALQNQGAPESAREGAFPVVFLHKHLRQHPCEHSPGHPDFGEHTREHSRELFWGFPISGQSPRPGSSLLLANGRFRGLLWSLLDIIIISMFDSWVVGWVFTLRCRWTLLFFSRVGLFYLRLIFTYGSPTVSKNDEP